MTRNADVLFASNASQFFVEFDSTFSVTYLNYYVTFILRITSKLRNIEILFTPYSINVILRIINTTLQLKLSHALYRIVFRQLGDAGHR